VPGTVQIYYVGLLAGRGDLDRLRLTGSGREVNRHVYTAEEVTTALAGPVARATVFLARLRQGHPAFSGTAGHEAGAQAGSLRLWWQAGEQRVELEAVPGRASFTLTWTVPGGVQRAAGVDDLADARVPASWTD
jgi:sucrose phosphorylase